MDRILSGKRSREKTAIVLGAFMMLFGYPTMELGNVIGNGPMAATGTIFWGLGAISLLVGVLAFLGFINLKELSKL
jgi:hypothetical protein